MGIDVPYLVVQYYVRDIANLSGKGIYNLYINVKTLALNIQLFSIWFQMLNLHVHADSRFQSH